MPKGPRGEKRPGDVIGAAIMVAKIATGEEPDNATPADKAHHSRGGKIGGAARALKLTAEQRADIARVAAEARWKKS
jgi:Spy/CpxP family protein refolding chaperone